MLKTGNVHITISFMTLLSALTVFLSPTILHAQAMPLTGWRLVWSDEFNGTTLDANKWIFETSEGNAGLSSYTNRTQNLSVQNGNLVITAIKESYNNKQYTSSQISTRGKADWKFCRIDIRGKVPKGKGLWPAFWMMPTADVYGGWPRSGELDIFEGQGAAPTAVLTHLIYGSPQLTIGGTYLLRPGMANLADSFHVYTMYWDSLKDSACMKFYLDTFNYCNFNRWYPNNCTFPAPYNELFFFIIDLSIGNGTYWAGPPDNTTPFPAKLLVDWVHVYKRTTPIVTAQPAVDHARMNSFSIRTEGNTLVYELKTGAATKVELCTMAGQKISTLINKYQPAGRYRTSISETGVKNGVYMCRLTSGPTTEVQKISCLLERN
jgi:beta-glucanase (GH16 family)